jgi:hypothetical protein
MDFSQSLSQAAFAAACVASSKVLRFPAIG